eukprot:5654509-Prymnesium_polylepis.2
MPPITTGPSPPAHHSRPAMPRVRARVRAHARCWLALKPCLPAFLTRRALGGVCALTGTTRA